MEARLLIVEDDPSLLQVLSRVCERRGFHVSTARSGPAALQKVSEARPDLVILDVMLPGMSGLEVCQQLRSLSAPGDLAIIMLSALSAVDDKIRGLQAGADDYVAKPFNVDELCARAEAQLTRLHRARELAPEKARRLVAFVGVQGGVGTTTVAANVAVALADAGSQVIVADFQPWPSSMRWHLGLNAATGWESLLELEAAEMTSGQVLSRLCTHSERLRVLPSPQSFGRNGHVPADHAKALLEALAGLAPYVVLDLPRPPSQMALAALARCDRLFLVMEPTAHCVTLAKELVQGLMQWQPISAAFRAVVVNRAPTASPTAPTEIERVLGIKVVAAVPLQTDLSLLAIDRGSPVVLSAPGSALAQTFKSLATDLANGQA